MKPNNVLVIVMLAAVLSACIALPPAAQPAAAQPASEAVAAQDGHDHDHDETGSADELGTVNFPITCTPEAQAEFNQGMAFLHSFWFGPAANSFNKVAELDATCAMADWGLAMTYLGNPFSWPLSGQPLVDGWAAVEQAMAIGTQTPREAAYIDAVRAFYEDADTVDHHTRALAYVAAMEQLSQDYPDDTEGAIYYALALISTALPTDKSYANQLRAVEILTPYFEAHPDHPGVAHYIIHANDYPTLAAQGIDAALRYSEIAPDAPHAQHMPSHIFTRLGYWHESIEVNLTSAEVVEKELAAANKQGLASFSLLHPMDYLMYAYLQLGQDGAATALLNETLAFEAMDTDHFVGAYAFASIPARYALERGQWAEAAALTLHPPSLAWDKFPQAEAVTVFARALGAARMGDVAAARQDLERLPILAEAMLAINQAYWAGQAEIQIKEVEAWIALAEGNSEAALALMHEAVALEDATEKNAVTPGPLVPAHELLGEMLLELDQPEAARAEFEASRRVEPGRWRGLYGAARAAELAGDPEDARSLYQELVTLAESADTERPELTVAMAFLE